MHSDKWKASQSIREIYDRPRLLNRFQSLQGIMDDGHLRRFVSGIAQRFSRREFEVEGSRRFYKFGDLFAKGDRDRRYSRIFYHPLNQSNGLIAYDSRGR